MKHEVASHRIDLLSSEMLVFMYDKYVVMLIWMILVKVQHEKGMQHISTFA